MSRHLHYSITQRQSWSEAWKNLVRREWFLPSEQIYWAIADASGTSIYVVELEQMDRLIGRAVVSS